VPVRKEQFLSFSFIKLTPFTFSLINIYHGLVTVMIF
jgi:hypothetical protein